MDPCNSVEPKLDFKSEYFKNPVEHQMRNSSLANSWTFWYFEDDKCRSWCDGQKYICTIFTNFDFWCLVKYFIPASQIGKGCDYSLFKNGIVPMWEDPANRNGGRWMFYLRCEELSLVDFIWLRICSYAIGSSGQHADNINGVAVSHRFKAYKLSLWVKDCNIEIVHEIGHHLRATLGLGEGCLKFQPHQAIGTDKNSAYPPYYVL